MKKQPTNTLKLLILGERNIKMYYLKYYKKEIKEFEEYNSIFMNGKEIEDFIVRCCNNFNILTPIIRYSFMSKTLGCYYENKRLIKFTTARKISVMVVAHELAHHFDSIINGKYRIGYNLEYTKMKYRKAHTKKHKNEMIRIFNYYDEINNRKKEIPTLKYDWNEVVIEI